MARPKSAVSRTRTASSLPKKDSFTRKQESLERLLEQEDDLEYSITFPSPAPVQDYVFVYQDDIEPVVYLLGWEGCSDEELSDYSSVYEERGCITIRYTAPIHCLALNREETQPLAARLAGLLEEMCISDSPVFVHAFGNNGAGMYQYLKEELINVGAGDRLGGVVFDSGPAETGMGGLFHAVYKTMSGHWVYKAASAALLMMLSAATGIMKQLGNFLCFPVSPPAASPAQFVANEASPPALFIFSTADPGVDTIAISREEAGGVVVAVKYEDTEHLDHFGEHRESYINALVNFLHDCMGQ